MDSLFGIRQEERVSGKPDVLITDIVQSAQKTEELPKVFIDFFYTDWYNIKKVN